MKIDTPYRNIKTQNYLVMLNVPYIQRKALVLAFHNSQQKFNKTAYKLTNKYKIALLNKFVPVKNRCKWWTIQL